MFLLLRSKKLLRNCKLQQNIFAEFSSSFNAGSEMRESEEKEREWLRTDIQGSREERNTRESREEQKETHTHIHAERKMR
jgi:hypothetical protein